MPKDEKFPEDAKKLWEKAKVIAGKDPKKYRQDVYGKEIYLYSYGKPTEKGWQKDHIIPKSKGGNDTINNQQVLNSHTNMSKGNSQVKKSRHSKK